MNHQTSTQAAHTALHQLAQDAGLQVDWEDAGGHALRVNDDVLRAALRSLGLPADTATDVRDSRARLQAEADSLTVPLLATGVAGQPIELATALPQLSALAGRPYRIDLEQGGAAEGTVHAGADREHATLRLAPVQAAGYHRLRIDTGAYTGIEATLAIAPARCYSVADALQARGRPPRAGGAPRHRQGRPRGLRWHPHVGYSQLSLRAAVGRAARNVGCQSDPDGCARIPGDCAQGERQM